METVISGPPHPTHISSDLRHDLTASLLRKLLLALAVCQVLGFGVDIPFLAVNKKLTSLFLLLTAVFMLLTPYVLFRRGRVKGAAWFLAATGTVLMTAFVFLDGGVRFSGVGAQLGMAVVAVVLLGRRAMFLALGALVADFGMAALEVAGFSWKFFPAPPIPTSFGILLVFVVVLPLVDDAVRHLGRALEVSQKQLWEQRQAQEQIVYQAQLIAQAADPVVAADNNHVVTFWNAAAARLFGWPEKEALGRSLHDVLRVSSSISRQSVWEELARSGSCVGEFPMLARSGEPLVVNAAIATLRNAAGETVGTVAGLRDITEQKRAVEMLRKSEERFRELVESVEAIVWDKDAATLRVTFVSQGTEKILGYSPDQWTKIPAFWADHLHPQDRERALACEREVLEKGEAHSVEYRMRAADGRCVWFRDFMHPVPGSEGKTERLRGIMVDITESKRAGEALRESEERFRSLVQNATVGIYRTTPDGRILMANPTMVRMLGYDSFQELASINVESQGYAGGFPRRAFREQVEREGEVKGFESAWQKRDGTAIFIRESARVVRAGDGRVLYYDGIVEDVTERKRAGEALEQAAKRFKLVTLATQDAVFDWDLVSHEIWRNENYQRLFGAPERSLDSDNWWDDRLHPEDRERVLSAQAAALGSEGNLLSSEYRLRRPDGSYADTVERSLIVRDANGQAVRMIGALTDISERKRAEETLKVSHAFLRIANRHREMSPLLEEFVAEVRNYTGRAAVGIRMLDEEGKIPYQASRGFSQRFYELESPLSIRSDQCMCINVIKGTADPKLSFYTEGGSFYMNGTTRFLATVSEEEKGKTRNVCNQMGYESVALVPIRSEGRILGLIHVADPQENKSPLAMVEVLEAVAIQLGTAIQRVWAEEALAASEQRYWDLFENATDIVFTADLKGNFTSVNKAFERSTGYTRAELTCMNVLQLLAPEHVEEGRRAVEGLAAGREAGIREWEIVTKEGRRVCHEMSPRLVRRKGEPTEVQAIARDITERKRAEEALRESEQRYREVFENASDCIFLIDVAADARFKFAGFNPAEEKAVGFANADLSGKFIDEALPAALAHQVTANYRRCVQTGTLIEYDEELDLPVGPRYFHTVLIPVRNDAGRIYRVVGIARDVTERKRAEEALRRLNRQLQAISSCNQTLLRAVDEQTLLNDICRIICDEAGYRLAWVGYAEHDVGKAVRPVASAGSDSGYIASAKLSWSEETERGRGPAGTAIRSGKSVWVEDISTDPLMAPWRDDALQRGYRSGMALPLKDEDANVFGVLMIYYPEANAITPDEVRLMEGLAGDLAFGITVLRTRTERKRAEEALEASQARFRTVIEQAPVAISVSRYGSTLYVNQKYMEMFGFQSVDELVGKSIGEQWSPACRAVVEERARQRSLGLPVPARYEGVGQRRDGSQFPVEATVATVDLLDGRTALGFLTDITERRRAEEDRQRSVEQLRALAAHLENVREEERKRAAREIHDQLGQALTAIKLDLSSLAREVPADQQERAKRTSSMLKLVDETIRSVRRISTELRPGMLDDLGLVATVEWAAEEFATRTGTKCRLDLPQEHIAVDAETATAVFRIFQETLTNVARHSEAGEVKVYLAKEDGDLILEVRDNGRGVAADELSSAGSLGILGMRERAMLLGGELTITGAPGKGTTVRVRIPGKPAAGKGETPCSGF